MVPTSSLSSKETRVIRSSSKTLTAPLATPCVWHFPHGGALENTIRIGDFKLIRNYDYLLNPNSPELELFRLCETTGDGQKRVDFEEAKNLAEALPEKTAEMNQHLTEILEEMEASYPSYNPNTGVALPNKEKASTVLTHRRTGPTVEFTDKGHGAKVVHADLIYPLNGGTRYEEWFRTPATLKENNKITAELPKGTTHFYLNLIDENNFLRSYPEVQKEKKSKSFNESALAISAVKKVEGPKKKKGDRNAPFNRWDTNEDDILTLKEYLQGQTGPDVEARYKRFDKNKDGEVTREEYVVLSAR